MNKARREKVSRCVSQLEEIRETLRTLEEEEAESRDNLPEALQEGERGEAMEDARATLEAAGQSVEDALGELGNIELG